MKLPKPSWLGETQPIATQPSISILKMGKNPEKALYKGIRPVMKVEI
jgi:hypothetical protein